jgi:hypothetical protein
MQYIFSHALATILPKNVWVSDLTNKYLSDLAEQHNKVYFPNGYRLLTDTLLCKILEIFQKLYLEKYVG